ncbi:MAG: hypothetical protein KDH99_11965 [Alcanivoracaceae bacterium]|nr:hypothetical protein [Alcanivoracaceae bacterium]
MRPRSVLTVVLLALAPPALADAAGDTALLQAEQADARQRQVEELQSRVQDLEQQSATLQQAHDTQAQLIERLEARIRALQQHDEQGNARPAQGESH